MTKINQHGSSHHGNSNQVAEENATITSIKGNVETQMINPFTCTNKTDLINIATGQKALSNDLVYAQEKGIEAIKNAEDTKAAKIISPKISPFSCKIISGKKGVEVLKIYKEESSVTRALWFLQDSEYRGEAFSHEWIEYPPSLFEPDSSISLGYEMRKGVKSDYLCQLLKEVEGTLKQHINLPSSDLQATYLVDAMAFVQRFQNLGAKTF